MSGATEMKALVPTVVQIEIQEGDHQKKIGGAKEEERVTKPTRQATARPQRALGIKRKKLNWVLMGRSHGNCLKVGLMWVKFSGHVRRLQAAFCICCNSKSWELRGAKWEVLQRLMRVLGKVEPMYCEKEKNSTQSLTNAGRTSNQNEVGKGGKT